ncbi:MAG: hypothetical protein ACRDSH_11120, partial [Pseudonocardiaceae bacterium]
MRRSSESEEREQFTVAELLARYGEPGPTTGRRRRRAADDSDAAAAQNTPQPLTEPSWAASRQLGASSSGPLPLPEVSAPQRFTPAEPSRIDSLRRDSSQVEMTQPGLRTLTDRDWSPAVTSPPGTASQIPRVPPVVPGPPTPTGTGLPGLRNGPVTDQIPKFDPSPGELPSWSSRRASQPPAGLGTPAGPGTATSAIPEQSGDALAADAAADGEQEAESDSPWWEWAVMVS